MNDRAGRLKGRSAHGGVLLVPCRINGLHRYWFLADTGATLTVIRPWIAGEVGIDVTRPLRHQQITSVHQAERVPVVSLGQVQVGHHRLTDIEALVLELPHSSCSSARADPER